MALALEDPSKKKKRETSMLYFPQIIRCLKFTFHLQRSIVLYGHMDTACHFTRGVCEVTMAIKKQPTDFLKREESSLQSFLSLSHAVVKNGAWIMSYWWLISNLEVD